MCVEVCRKMHYAESRNRDSEYCRMTRSDQKEMLRKVTGDFKPLARTVKRGGRVAAMNLLAQVEGWGMLDIEKGGEKARVWCKGQNKDNQRMEFLVVDGKQKKVELYSINPDVAADAVVTDLNVSPNGMEQTLMERQKISDFILGVPQGMPEPKQSKKRKIQDKNTNSPNKKAKKDEGIKKGKAAVDYHSVADGDGPVHPEWLMGSGPNVLLPRAMYCRTAIGCFALLRARTEFKDSNEIWNELQIIRKWHKRLNGYEDMILKELEFRRWN